jgi:hypothetical protein
MVAERPAGPGPVLRLRLRYVDGQWTVRQRVRVASKRLPASEELPPRVRISGFWYEAVGRNGETVYRRRLPYPPDLSVEVRSDSGGLYRAPSHPDDVTVEVLIPDLPEIVEVRLFSSAPDFPDVGREVPARQVASLPARDDDGGKGGYGSR